MHRLEFGDREASFPPLGSMGGAQAGKVSWQRTGQSLEC